jgi:hypothetical protein
MELAVVISQNPTTSAYMLYIAMGKGHLGVERLVVLLCVLVKECILH